MSRRICIFCAEEGQMSREHVLGRWMRKKIAASSEMGLHVETHLVEGEIVASSPRPGSPMSWTTRKIVCTNCNNGWMERLENRVDPVLVDLAFNNPSTISVADQRAISAWAYKTALVVDVMPGKPPFLSSGRRLAAVVDCDSVPSDVVIGLVRFEDKDSHHISRIHYRTFSVTTLTFRGLSLQVFIAEPTLPRPGALHWTPKDATHFYDRFPWSTRIFPYQLAPVTPMIAPTNIETYRSWITLGEPQLLNQ